MMRYLEDLCVGDETCFDGGYEVTEGEIIEVGMRWDPHPFHTDPEAAKGTIFGGLVASSAHIFAIWVSLGRSKIDEGKCIASVSALGFDKLQWHVPVRPGDTLRKRQIVVAVRESKSKPDLGVVSIEETVFNHADETVFTLECSFLVPKRTSSSSETARSNPVS